MRWVGHALGRGAALVFLDILVPLAVYAGLSTRGNRHIVESLNQVLPTSRISALPSDFNGSVWLYWWVHRALSTGESLGFSQVLCYPHGQDLASNFPNYLDAILAFPFLEFGSYPAGFNLFCLAIPVLSAFGGYLGFRAITSSRLLALAAGAMFGFNVYTIHELQAGRMVTGLIAILPLVIGAWIASQRAYGWGARGWLVLTGVLAGIAVLRYIPFAVWLGMLGTLYVVARTFWPLRGTSRLRASGSLLVVSGIALAISGPYLYHTRVKQFRTRDSHAETIRQPGVSPVARNPWRELLRTLTDDFAKRWQTHRGRRQNWEDVGVRSLQAKALPADYLWENETGDDHAMLGFLPPGVLLLLVAAGLLAWPRGVTWLGGALLFYTLSLGPYLTTLHQGALAPVTAGQYLIKLPMYWLLRFIPFSETFLWPYRAVPMAWLCLVATLVVSFDHLAEAVDRRYREKGGRSARLAAHAIVWAGTAVAAGCVVWPGGGERLSLDFAPWDPHPFLRSLAGTSQDIAVVELPMGLGEGTAIYQTVHETARAEGHQATLQRLERGQPPPPPCYDLSFLRALWFLELESGPNSAYIDEGLAPAAIRNAAARGFRYVLIYARAYKKLGRRGLLRDLKQVVAELSQHLGPPIVEANDLVVFEIPREGTPSPVH